MFYYSIYNMALQVWLPLNGSIVNQGVSPLTFSLVSSNTASNASGKMGSCYSNNSWTAGGLVSNTTLNLGSVSSMACWVKFTSLTDNSSLGGAMVGQHRYQKNSGMGLTFKYVSSTTGYLSVNTGNGSGRTYNTYCGKTLLSANNWYHVAYTYDGNTIRLYVNGVLDGSHSYPGQYSPADYVHVFCWSFSDTAINTSTHANYKLNGYLNDVRIYDHCLSTKEVKEISKGLMLHYKLDGGVNGNPNLSQVESLIPNPVSGGSGEWSSWNITSDGTSRRMTCTKTGVGGRYWNPFPNSVRDTTKYYTWSIYLRANKAIDNVRVGLEGGTVKTVTITTSWERFDATSKLGNTSNQAFIVYPYENASVDDWIEMKMLKVEEGQVLTPWSPSAYDVGGIPNQEIDVSGFRNNGTKTGSISVVSDSPRYSCCYEFGNNGYISAGQANGKMPTDTITVACWSYLPDWNITTPMRMISCTEGGGFQISINETGSGSVWVYLYRSGVGYQTLQYASSKLSAGWHHFAFTFSGAELILYVDSVVGVSASLSNTGIGYNSTAPLLISGEPSSSAYTGASWLGKISDVRIYATALSADDIKQLYQNSASIDKQGNLFCGEVIEQ